ncbi:MAG: replication initiator protein A, partial [Bryobacteraceae bacterium]|nr:replication initiator protein A [Bryobacteraceae bacterium]
MLPLEEVPTESASREFVKVEKNLSTLGFFTPSKSRGKTVLVEKTITFRREEQGRQIEVTATILPSAKYGLPSTADQDKYFAFQKIVSDLRDRWGRVQNPVGFTSTEMLQILGMRDSGTNYQDIQEWLKRMTLTGISSKGVVYLSKRRTWVSDTFHVFDRVVEFGADLGNGDIADRNYVWLSDWQLENINNNYVMPVDLDRYWKLKGTIAKAMVPLLQLWLYASRSRGLFEKRYSDLTTILDIRRHQHLSLIRKQLAPSLDELVSQGYLESWDIEETKDHQDYKIIAAHSGPLAVEGRRRPELTETVKPAGAGNPEDRA